MTCRELAREVTAYTEGALAPPDRERFEAHRLACPECRLHVAQWQAMISSLGRLEDRSEGATGTEKERLVALFREHGFHRPGRPKARVPLGLDGELAAPGDHLAYFCESEQDFLSTVGFVAAGAAQGETCILLGHDQANDRLGAAIRDAGLDAAALRRQGRLRLVPGMRSADALLEEIAEQVKSAVAHGAPLVRILGNLGWGRPEWPGDRELLRLEARVTEAVRRLPVIVLCAYDVRGVAGSNLLLGGLECHPLTYRRNALRPNGLYVPAEPFLASLPPHVT
jgi:MEDS: MEthanogen/methylotroph, DcmR Sensory domain/Putative zinc-finger